MSEQAAAIWVDTSSLTPWHANPRKNDQAVPNVAASIERFGFASPIIANKDGQVIAGHTRLKAAELLGLDKVPVRYMDLDDVDARLLALADNKVSEIAEWDDKALADVIRELEENGADLEGLGWSDDDINSMLSEVVKEEEKPEIQFSEELLEAQNYVLLTFDNEMDWLAAQDHFQLETKAGGVKRKDGTAWSAGIGRVVEGASYLKKVLA